MLAKDRKAPSSTTAAYLAEVSRALAEMAYRQGFDLLGYLLEMAALEAQSDLETMSADVDFGRSPSSLPVRNPSAKPPIELLAKSLLAEKIEEANQDLEKAAKLADEAVEERRRNLHAIDRVERNIQRMQSQNSRLLGRLIKAA